LDDLAQATGSSKSYMWEIENKDVARPSGEKLNKIAAALGVTPEYLLDATRTDVTEDVEDVAFYRKYQQLDADAKAKLKRILDVFDQ
jgi:transcriptional regulator with XRE-family HTH domain